MQKSRKKARRKLLALSRLGCIVLFAVVMIIGSVTGLLFFARPSSSALEKRDLTTFPAITVSSFLDGSWFSQISTWYSDTYPGRDSLLAMNRVLQKAQGITPTEQVVGGDHQADEIGKTPAEEEQPKDSLFDNRTELPDNRALAEDIQGQITEGLLVKDGAVYGGYYFNEASYQTYTKAVEQAAKELEGTTSVYSILVPNNSGVVLDEQTREKLGGSDQKQAIDYYYSNYSDLVHPVGSIDTLLDHADEYLYYRTDHHWTPLAAYYVYRNFCEIKGYEPEDKETMKTFHDEPFLGSYASELPTVDFKEDTFDAWIPNSVNTMKIFTADFGNPDSENYFENPVVNENPDIDMYSQYMRLIGGDRAFSVIDNPTINDGSSCVVVKESYGNAFVPWLVDHYDKVYVMDFREWDQPIVPWCKEHQITDLILINNIQLIASPTVADRYAMLLE